MAEAYEAYHLSHEDALTLASWSDDTMGSCILDLYRSAVPNIFATWGSQFGPTASPGLVLYPELDPFGNEEMSNDVATTFNARQATIRDAGHWWALEAPVESAAAIRTFIDSL
jgi:pimeloyl-ACP methyl ester carboxylesterase